MLRGEIGDAELQNLDRCFREAGGTGCKMQAASGKDIAQAILAEADRSRLPKLVPERYRRMTASPFAFFRGAAAVMVKAPATLLAMLA